LGSLVNIGLRPLLLLHIHISPSTSSGQRNSASWAFQPQKSVTLQPQTGRESTKSIRDMWWLRKDKKTPDLFVLSCYVLSTSAQCALFLPPPTLHNVSN
jgi:hypothetical protein